MQVEDLKRWLESYMERQRDLDSNYERLERLEARLTSPKSAVLTGTPGAAASDPDRLTVPLAELQEMREATAEQAAALRDLRYRIEGAVRLIDGPDWPNQRAVLRMRYLDGERWEDVCFMLFWRDPDYLIKLDTYRRRVFKIRNSALRKLAAHPQIYEYIEEEKMLWLEKEKATI